MCARCMAPAATTTIAADLVRNVGGDGVHVDSLVPAGADPHGHEPRPSDAVAISEAELVVKSGGDLDEWLDELIESAGGEATEITLLDSVEAIEGGHAQEEDEARADEEDEDLDPHWWQDPRNAILAVQAIRDALIEADRDGRGAYERNARAYTSELRALVEEIEDEGVEAIFPEAAVSQRLERAISRESGDDVGAELWTESLGGDESGAETYLDAMRANAGALAEGMSGGRVSCGG